MLELLSIAEIRAALTAEQRAEIQQQRAQIQREIAAGIRCPHGHLDPYADCTPCSRGMSPPPLNSLCPHGRSWATCPTCASHS